jgi:hypothetical protein
VPGPTRHLATQLVQLKGPVGDAELAQNDLVGPEGIGFHRIAANGQKVLVDLPNDIRPGLQQDLRAVLQTAVIPLHIKSKGMDIGAHGPIEHQHTALQGLEERGWLAAHIH